MGTLKTFFETSELATYQKVFPSLTVPTIETQDADGYLKAMTQAVIEQIKYLNTFAGIPLEVLYENIGQRHKASNIAAAAMLKKTGNIGEGLDMIDIPGDGIVGTYTNILWTEPVGVNNPETGEPTDTLTFPVNLWQAQSNLIEQQNAYLDDIKATFTEKREDLKVGFTMKEFTQSGAYKFIADLAIKKVTDWLTDAYPGVADDAILDTIATYAPRSIGWGLVWLHKQFLAGGILCERMKEENLQLLKLAASIDMYKMRSDIISQHDLTIQSLLSQVALVETQLGKQGGSDLAQILDGALYATYDPKLGFKRNAGLTEHLNRAFFFKDKEGLNEDIGLATLIKELVDIQQGGVNSSEPVIQCPHTGDFLYAHSRGKMTKL